MNKKNAFIALVQLSKKTDTKMDFKCINATFVVSSFEEAIE